MESVKKVLEGESTPLISEMKEDYKLEGGSYNPEVEDEQFYKDKAGDWYYKDPETGEWVNGAEEVRKRRRAREKRKTDFSGKDMPGHPKSPHR